MEGKKKKHPSKEGCLFDQQLALAFIALRFLVLLFHFLNVSFRSKLCTELTLCLTLAFFLLRLRVLLSSLVERLFHLQTQYRIGLDLVEIARFVVSLVER